jgi:hypothetical protein
MPDEQEIAEKHSLTLSAVLKDANSTSVYLATGAGGKKCVLKVYRATSKNGGNAAVERNFLAWINREKLEFLHVPRLLDYGDNYMLMEYVEREHWTRDTILERKWPDVDVKLWVKGLVEFQNMRIPKSWFSLKQRIMGFMYPAILAAILLPKCSRVIGMRDRFRLIGLAVRYGLARFHFRNKVTHYDLQTYNYSFCTDREKASLLDFELSYYMGDPLYDVLYYTSIPVQKIPSWTFQTRLINTYLAESRERGKHLRCRMRLILLVCNLNRYLYFRDESDKKSVYLDNIRMLLSDGAFNTWFSEIAIDGHQR